MRAAWGCRQPAQDKAFCISACPFAAARHDPCPDRGRLHVGGSLLAGHVLASEVISLAAVSSPPVLSESSKSHSIGPPTTGLGPTRPAHHAMAGRRLSYPSRIRVERGGDTGCLRLGARCLAAAGAAPGQVCTAGPSRPVRASPKGGTGG